MANNNNNNFEPLPILQNQLVDGYRSFPTINNQGGVADVSPYNLDNDQHIMNELLASLAQIDDEDDVHNNDVNAETSFLAPHSSSGSISDNHDKNDNENAYYCEQQHEERKQPAKTNAIGGASKTATTSWEPVAPYNSGAAIEMAVNDSNCNNSNYFYGFRLDDNFVSLPASKIDHHCENSSNNNHTFNSSSFSSSSSNNDTADGMTTADAANNDDSCPRKKEPNNIKYFNDNQGDKWNKHFKDLLKYRSIHGHCNVPFRPNTPLAQWVKRQRHQFRLKQKGEHSTLTTTREQLLDEAGFVWDAQTVVWEKRFKELQAYKLLHGHCNVPSSFRDNPKLAIWVKSQRRQYKEYHEKGRTHRYSAVIERRNQRLTTLGFEWSRRSW